MSDRETGTYTMTVEEVDDFVVNLCRDWYDGTETPEMTALVYRNTYPDRMINVVALLAEFESCAATCALIDEKPALEKALATLRDLIERNKLVADIEALVARCHDAGMERGDFDTICSKAWSQRQDLMVAPVSPSSRNR